MLLLVWSAVIVVVAADASATTTHEENPLDATVAEQHTVRRHHRQLRPSESKTAMTSTTAVEQAPVPKQWEGDDEEELKKDANGMQGTNAGDHGNREPYRSGGGDEEEFPKYINILDVYMDEEYGIRSLPHI
ncbi:hypothetical protein ACA910_017319 [Epithemia clementina (nom. ined.)]